MEGGGLVVHHEKTPVISRFVSTPKKPELLGWFSDKTKSFHHPLFEGINTVKHGGRQFEIECKFVFLSFDGDFDTTQCTQSSFPEEESLNSSSYGEGETNKTKDEKSLSNDEGETSVSHLEGQSFLLEREEGNGGFPNHYSGSYEVATQKGIGNEGNELPPSLFDEPPSSSPSTGASRPLDNPQPSFASPSLKSDLVSSRESIMSEELSSSHLSHQQSNMSPPQQRNDESILQTGGGKEASVVQSLLFSPPPVSAPNPPHQSLTFSTVSSVITQLPSVLSPSVDSVRQDRILPPSLVDEDDLFGDGATQEQREREREKKHSSVFEISTESDVELGGEEIGGDSMLIREAADPDEEANVDESVLDGSSPSLIPSDQETNKLYEEKDASVGGAVDKQTRRIDRGFQWRKRTAGSEDGIASKTGKEHQDTVIETPERKRRKVIPWSQRRKGKIQQNWGEAPTVCVKKGKAKTTLIERRGDKKARCLFEGTADDESKEEEEPIRRRTQTRRAKRNQEMMGGGGEVQQNCEWKSQSPSMKSPSFGSLDVRRVSLSQDPTISVRMRKTGSRELSNLSEPSIVRERTARKKKMTKRTIFVSSHAITDRIRLMIRQLDGILALSIQEASEMVVDSVRRTMNFLIAMALGIPIVSSSWLQACQKANRWVDTEKYLLHDPAGEEKWGFSLKESFNKASQRKIFEGMRFLMNKRVFQGDEFDAIESLIKSGGGEVLATMPRDRKDILCICDGTRNIPVQLKKCAYSAEFIKISVMRQVIDLSENQITSSR